MLKKRLLKDVILSETIGALNMRKRKELQSAIQGHINNLIEDQSLTLSNRLNQLKINYIIEKCYDDNFFIEFKLVILEFNIEILVAKRTLEKEVLQSEFENIKLIKSLVEIDDEFNFEKNKYTLCRNVIKEIYTHISDKLNMSYEHCRKTDIVSLEEMYLLNNHY